MRVIYESFVNVLAVIGVCAFVFALVVRCSD